MTSQKQINLLKEEINLLLAEYEENSVEANISRGGKNREPRNSIHSVQMSKPRENRTSSFMDESIISNQTRVNRAELQAAQKTRE